MSLRGRPSQPTNRRRRIATAVALTLSLAAASAGPATASSSTAAAWTPFTAHSAAFTAFDKDFTPADLDVTEFDAADGPNGTTTAIWVQSTSGPYAIRARRVTKQGSQGPSLDVFTPSGSSPGVTSPKVVTASDGSSTAVWKDFADSLVAVRARRIGSNGNLGPILTLIRTHEDKTIGGVSIAPSGVTTVTWSRFDGTSDVVEARRIAANGKLGSTLKVTADGFNASEPNVVTASNGVSRLVWERSNGVTLLVQTRVVDAAGRLGSTKNLSTAANQPEALAVAGAADGSTIVAWKDYSDGAIRGRTIDPKGRFGSLTTLSALGDTTTLPFVSLSPKGVGAVGWRKSAFYYTLQARGITTGGKLGPIVSVSRDGVEDVYAPSATTSTSGITTFAWSDGRTNSARVRRMNATGLISAAEPIVSPAGVAVLDSMRVAPSLASTSSIVYLHKILGYYRLRLIRVR